jgi:hypothetical protein
MKHLKIILAALFISGFPFSTLYSQVVWFDGKSPITYSIDKNLAPVVHAALEMWKGDMQQVTGVTPFHSHTDGKIRIVQLSRKNAKELHRLGVPVDSLGKKKEAFCIKQLSFKRDSGGVLVVGSDARGLAYGILELSRLAGVSPWAWWADVLPEKRTKLTLPADFQTFQTPSVEYRGLFLNDEDWGLTPWSTKTFEPEAKTKFPIKGRFRGQIGPKTYEQIFQLLLRLRANTIWPAMHEVTMPFYFVKGNRQMAEKYGMLVSTSHCEPMMRNSATEWDLLGKGAYNYFTNRDSVLTYWEERLAELGNSENIFTIGMRGKHDGRMEGARNTQQYKEALTRVIEEQTDLLKRYVNNDVAKIPQQFIPYKEVLDVYKADLRVPDYVTLVWPDDNHGYIRHFPTDEERARSGGNGVYYHASYWGEPHDNLWLGSVQPSLMYQQMTLAYERGVRKIWILNVGDIKPSEYLTELFLDMAWSVKSITTDKSTITSEKFVEIHLYDWLVEIFNEKAGAELFPAMQEFYLLNHIRKPEFMGNSRVYDKTRAKIADLPWSEKEIFERLARFEYCAYKVKETEKTLPENRRDAYFQLIKYPVLASTEMNKKLLYAQLARHSAAPDDWWKKSDAAYDSIVALTDIYNSLNNGKWKDMMSFKPRNLPVYERVQRVAESVPALNFTDELIFRQNGAGFAEIAGNYRLINGLGYGGEAICLEKDCTVKYALPVGALQAMPDSITVEIHLVPTHAVEGKTLRFAVKFGNHEPRVFDSETAEFSEAWKENVLRSQAIFSAKFIVPKGVLHTAPLEITAIDAGIVIDQIEIITN